MGKRELLLATKKNIEENGFVTCKYYDPNENCYCAVGYVLKELGMTDNELLVLGGDAIDFVINGIANVPDELRNRVIEVVENSGFTTEEITNLQYENDCTRDSNKTKILTYIDEQIENLPV
jgi:hypothetical protein